MLVTSGIEASPIEITQAVKNGQTGKCVAEVIEQAQSMRIIDRGFISSAIRHCTDKNLLEIQKKIAKDAIST